VLNPSQQAIATHRVGIAVALGGPRTGKTTALMEAALAGLDDGAPQVMFFTRSRRARLDLRARLSARQPQLAARLRVTTVHAFAGWVLGHVDDQSGPPQVLSAARQDGYIRDLVAGQPTQAWPQRFDQARQSSRFAGDVREAVAACQRAGLSPRQVEFIGAQAGRDDWMALGGFYQEYLDVLGLAQAVDYPELLIRADQVLSDPEALERVRPAGSMVIVDDAEDLDGLQLDILDRLIDRSTPAILAWDPDTQVYGFRGTVARSVSAMITQWRDRGWPTAVVGLDRGFDVAGQGLRASSAIRDAITLPVGIDLAAVDRYRSTQADADGRATKLVFPDPNAEAAWIAQRLRQAHLRSGLAYESMAVIVRRRDQLARYAMACQEAGVPVALSGDEIQLSSEPVVSCLLAGLRVIRDQEQASMVDVRAVVFSPLGPSIAAVASAGIEAVLPRLFAPTCSDDDPLFGLWSALTAGVGSLEASVADVAWALWSHSTWQQRLLDEAGSAGEQAWRAHRDLDAVVALFALAEQFSDLPARSGITALNEAVTSQEIPEDLPRSSSWSSSAVRLTTAHRAKSWSWPLVVVAGVESSIWPARSTPIGLIDLDGLSESIVLPSDRDQLTSERRSLYVACSSASCELIVTAVDGPDAQPSMLFEQIAAIEQVGGDSPESSAWSPAQLVGRLRLTLADENAHPGLRQAAADRLAVLAAQPGFRGADPTWWWGVGDARSEQPGVSGVIRIEEPGHRARATGVSRDQPGDGPGVVVRGQRQSVGIPGSDNADESPAMVLTASGAQDLLGCPRRWFLARKGQGQRPSGMAASVGVAIHAVVQERSASEEQMVAQLGRRWESIEFPAQWMRTTQWDQAVAMIGRYHAYQRWHDRAWMDSERAVDFTVPAPYSVTIQGRIDRLETDQQSKVWIVDYKTGHTLPTVAAAAANLQLGLYQLGVARGALGPGQVVGGAELVYLGQPDAASSALPKVFRQESLTDHPYLIHDKEPPIGRWPPLESVGSQRQHPTWVHHRLGLATGVLRQDTYPAIAGPGCRGCAFRQACPGLIDESGGA
jgi:superfamily I DNA/RNA helicase